MNIRDLLVRYRATMETVGDAPADQALLVLLEAYEDQIAPIAKQDIDYLHKLFRQIDIIDAANGHVDGAVWHLMHASKWWWKVIEEQKREDNEMTTLNAKSNET